MKDVPALVARLKAGDDPVSKYVRGRLDDGEREMPERFDDTHGAREPARNALTARPKELMGDKGLCEAEGVKGVAMSGRTRRLLARGHEVNGANRARLNRLLLAAPRAAR